MTKNKCTPKPARRMRLLPLTVTMLSLILVVKVNELYIGSKQLRELYTARTAQAEEKKQEEKPVAEKPKAAEEKPQGDTKAAEAPPPPLDLKPEEKKAEAKPEEKAAEKDAAKPEKADSKEATAEHGKDEKHGEADKKAQAEEPRTNGTGKSTVKEIEALKAKEAQPRYTQSELDLLQNLSKHRDELDAREQELALKAKVLEAAEKRMNDKLIEMKTLEGELSRVVAQYNEKQDAQLKSLVKIYENMKPDEAAKIFDETEMPILLDIISKMSERKVAPVLANMSPKKAKEVTQELADKRKRAAMQSSGTSGLAAPATSGAQ